MFLLVDFGTTSTKSALVDLDTGVFHDLQRHPSIPAAPGPAGHHQVPLAAIRARFDEICTHYIVDGGTSGPAAGGRGPTGQRGIGRHDVAGIVLCSEMHGFAVFDPVTRAPLTDYISWLDARALEPLDGTDTFSLVSQHLGDRFRQITGMRPRPGFPLLNFTHLARQSSAGGQLQLPDHPLLLSLPGYLSLCCEPAGTPALEHRTILAGMALYDVGTGQVSDELLDAVGELTGCRPSAGAPCGEGVAVGHWRCGDAAVPVFAGVGDHQCSVLGAGLTPGDCASLNLGTGSQVTVLDSPGTAAPDEAETRPYFDGRTLRTMTHIPAGRALAEYVGFLERVVRVAQPAAGHSEDSGESTPFWDLLAQLTAADVDGASLEIDLSIFDGARNFSGGGAIARVTEGSLTPRHYLASLLRAFVDQYGEVLELFDPDHQLQRLVLSGGIARNLPNLPELLASRTGYTAAGAAQLDESLLGLRTLSLVADGRASTCIEAQARYGRQCEVVD